MNGLFLRSLSDSNTDVPKNLVKVQAHSLDLDPGVNDSTPLTFIHLPYDFTFMRNFYLCSTGHMSEEVKMRKLVVFNR